MSAEIVRTFTTDEILAALGNYRQQGIDATAQLRELERLAEQLQTQLQMINGAILAFESLLQQEPGPGPEPPSET